MFSKNKVYHNPITGEYASLFFHNIKTIIVTDKVTIECDENTAAKMLEKLGFTKQVAQRPSIDLNTIREQQDDNSST